MIKKKSQTPSYALQTWGVCQDPILRNTGLRYISICFSQKNKDLGHKHIYTKIVQSQIHNIHSCSSQ